MDAHAPVSLRVLLVGDDPERGEAMLDGAAEGSVALTVVVAPDVDAARDHLERDRIDCLVVDCQPGADPSAVVSRLAETAPAVPIIGLVTDADDATAVLAAGAAEYVLDDVAASNPDRFTDRVVGAIERAPETALPGSVDWFDALLEDSMDALTVLAADGTITYQNPSIERLLGYEPEELLGTNSREYLHPDDRERVEETFADLYAAGSGATEELQFRFQAADGSWEWLESIVTARLDRGIEGFVINTSVITQRKEHEREVERYETLLSLIPDTIVITDMEGNHVDIYGFEGWSGYDPEELIGEPVAKTMSEADVERAEAVVQELILDGDRDKATYETTIVTKDGEPIPFENHVTTLPPDDEGNVPGVMNVLRDISDRKEREQRLEKAETVFQNVRDGVFLADVTDDGRFEYQRANAAFEEMIDRTEAEIRGKTPTEAFPGTDIAADIETAMAEVAETGSPIHREDHIDVPELPDYVAAWIAPVLVDDEVDGLVGIVRDITERKERQADLELKNRAMDEAPIGISISAETGSGTRLRYVNEGYQTLTGYSDEELLGREEWWGDLFGARTDEETIEELAAAADEGRVTSAELQLYRKDGAPRWFQVSLSPLEDHDGEVTHLVSFQQDITEIKEYETEIERRFDEFADLFAEDLREPIEQARSSAVTARDNGDETAIDDALEWLDRADSLLTDLAAVHSFTVPSRDHSESALRGAIDDD